MSGSADLFYLSIDEASQLIKDGELSPLEITQAYLDRIEACDPMLHSYITVTPEVAIAAAKTAEKEITAGQHRGPLHGIPIALKDLFDTEGVATTYGSKVYRDRIPAEDATTTARLKEAGCVLLGKLTMSELAMMGPPGFGEEARNPWNTEHVPGGSSSGSGVAVAAGLCAGALGTDTGGSIRFPASYNSIVGLMPTYGRVSRYGVMPLSWSLDHAGPMTRTVEDAALMLEAIAGFDPMDRTTSSEPVPAYRAALEADVKGLKVGVLHQAFTKIDPQTQAAVRRAIEELGALGAHLKEVSIPHLGEHHIANTVIYLTEGFNIFRHALRNQGQELGQVFRTYGYIGGLLSGDEYVQAQRLRSRTKRDVSAIFEQVDLIALPATVEPAAALVDFDPVCAYQSSALVAVRDFQSRLLPRIVGALRIQ